MGRFEALDGVVSDGRYGEISSVLVARSGRVIHERYADDQPGALRNTRSTKTVVGMLTGIAVERGLLGSVDDRVLDFFPSARCSQAVSTDREPGSP